MIYGDAAESAILVEVISAWIAYAENARKIAEQEFADGKTPSVSDAAMIWLSRRLVFGGPDEAVQKTRREISLMRTYKGLDTETLQNHFFMIATLDLRHSIQLLRAVEGDAAMDAEEKAIAGGRLRVWSKEATECAKICRDGFKENKEAGSIAAARWLANRTATGGADEVYHQARRLADQMKLLRRLDPAFLKDYFLRQMEIDLKRAAELKTWAAADPSAGETKH